MIHIRVAALGAAIAFVAATTGISYADGNGVAGDAIDRSVVQQGFDASPVPKEVLSLKGKDPALVGLGSYLVNGVADCAGCHTFPRSLNNGQPGSAPQYDDPFNDSAPDQSLTGQLKANFNVQHFLAGGRCFGAIMSRNITPDLNHGGLPGGLTEAEFIQVMRTGEDVFCGKYPEEAICNLFEGNPPPPQKRLQTMPWPVFHNMTDTDLKAIYAYLGAIPHREACNTVDLGCPGFSGPKGPFPPGFYTFNLAHTDQTCPNPPPPQ